MKAAKRLLDVSASKTESTNRARCEHRLGTLFNGSMRTAIDDSGSLAITAWTCAVCGDLIEEIHHLSRYGTVQRHPIRYTVATQGPTGRLSALSVRG